MNILIIRRDNIGDLVCTTPLIEQLSESIPNVKIDVLLNSYNEAVLQYHPLVNSIYIYSKAKHLEAGESKLRSYWQRFLMICKMRKTEYDYIILAGDKFAKRALSFAKKLEYKHIAGYDLPEHKRHLSFSLHEEDTHHVEKVTRLISAVTYQGKRLAPKNTDVKLYLTDKECVEGTTDTVGLHISSRRAANQWDATHFIALAEQLSHSNPQIQFKLFWSPGAKDDPRHPGDDEKASQILTALKSKDIPITPVETKHLRDLMIGLGACHTLICSDGGAMHIAAALCHRVIALFGDTRPEHWGPWGAQHHAIKAQDNHVNNIAVQDVLTEYQKA